MSVNANHWVARYGLFGGPGWQNGKWMDEGQLDTPYQWQQPKDTLDEVYRDHDLAYWQRDADYSLYNDPVKYWQDTINADKRLIDRVNALPNNGDFYHDNYREMSQALFRFKLLQDYKNFLGEKLHAGSSDPDSGLFGPLNVIPTAVSSLFEQAARSAKDPLVLDLDGDGIETTGLNASAPILFDSDADGVKTATGWVRPDDGILVMDRNGNGVIDSGRELFGDETLLPNGSRRLAGSGRCRRRSCQTGRRCPCLRPASGRTRRRSARPSGDRAPRKTLAPARHQFELLVASRRTNLDSPTGFEGEPPVIRALATANLRIVKQLLEAGANPNALDRGKRTPLIAAVDAALLNPRRSEFLEGVRLVASRPGVDFNAQYRGKTALQMAQVAGRRDLMEILERR
jgi:hypothetical protein